MSSVNSIICKAAKSLNDDGKDPFSAQELCVRAWELDPDKMGLRGYRRQHPDFNAVRAALSNGLVKRGHLVARGDGMFSAGIPFDVEAVTMSEEATILPTRTVQELRYMSVSPAAAKFARGVRDSITLAECLNFFKIGVSWPQDQTDEALDLAEDVFRDRCTPELRSLGAVNDWLRERFSRHLALLSHREKKGKQGERPPFASEPHNGLLVTKPRRKA
jgi:hypothetical protein